MAPAQFRQMAEASVMAAVTYTLVMIVFGGYYNSPAMGIQPGFTDRGVCDSAAAAFVASARSSNRPESRAFCFPVDQRPTGH